MTTVEIIRAKRDGRALAEEHVERLIRDYTAGEIPDYQMSAFLMAAFLNGLDAREAGALTRSMLHSGQVLDLSDIPGRKVDKHSTGGVGDKVSIALAPIVAACGVLVPMISGRGLGHTGGTLDKLEAIPGFRTNLDLDTYRRILADIGLVLIGQTDEIAPADRKIYALRDVTATVESIPFIASSIMSKKLAEGIDALVLDVKCGRGAFMKSEEDARRLAEALVAIGSEFDKPTIGLLTRMDVPLGRAVGNWPETREAIEILHGRTDGIEDIVEVTLALAGEMIHLGDEAPDAEAGRQLAEEAIRSGAALRKMTSLVEAQGGDPSVIEKPSLRPLDGVAFTIEAPDEARGFVADIDAMKIGLATVLLGAGRATKEDDVDPIAGLSLLKKPGDAIEPGEPLLEVFTSDESRLNETALLEAFSYTETAPSEEPMVIDRLSAAGWESAGA